MYNSLIITTMAIFKTIKGWGKQIEGIMDGDVDRFMEGLADEIQGLGRTAIEIVFGAPDYEDGED